MRIEPFLPEGQATLFVRGEEFAAHGAIRIIRVIRNEQFVAAGEQKPLSTAPQILKEPRSLSLEKGLMRMGQMRVIRAVIRAIAVQAAVTACGRNPPS